MTKNTKKQAACGPLFYQNWLAFEKTPSANITPSTPVQPIVTANTCPPMRPVIPEQVEVPLFTDINELTGEITSGLGPYKLLNAFSQGERADVPRIILRASRHFSPPISRVLPGEIKTSADFYHGGSEYDEIAALVSLAGGIRIMAGSCSRLFFTNGDPVGMPWYMNAGNNPRPFQRAGRPVIPRYPTSFCLNDCKQRLATLPRLTAKAVSELLVAARCYQKALWHSEADSQFAWLLFVSAIESAANFWRTKNDLKTALQEAMPDLYNLLKEKDADDADWINKIASHLKGLTGAVKKFADFLIKFWPETPQWAKTESPKIFEFSWAPRSDQHRDDWEKDTVAALKKVYNWRSRTLHGGTAFPPPMLRPPIMLGEKYEEKPIVFDMVTGDSSWRGADLPMLLHVFEHLVRGALLKWWDSMVPATASQAAPNSIPARRESPIFTA